MPRIAFSAALSTQHTELGTVPFDQVLLNDGGAYDPETGARPHSAATRGTGGLVGAAVRAAGWTGGCGADGGCSGGCRVDGGCGADRGLQWGLWG